MRRLHWAGFAPIRVIAGQRSRRLWRCCRLRVHRRVNFQAARLGPFSSVRLAADTAATAVLLVQSDTQLPANTELRRLRRALHISSVMAARLVDQHGHGGHPVLIAKVLAQHIRAAGEGERLDKLLQSMPGAALANLPTRRFRSFPRLNDAQGWNKARAQLRVWARRS